MQEENFLTIKNNGEHEIVIKKSKFITNLARTNNKEEAEEFIEKISKKYRDATHNTFAYTLGLKDDQVKASDNGEPSGTAGVPELKALQLMNLKNVTAVVTRYFGGIKLGAGGLIRAYSNSVTEAVQAIGVVKRVLQTELIISIEYPQLDKLNYHLSQEDITIADTEYGTGVKVKVFVDEAEVENVKNSIINLLNGQVKINIGKNRFNEVEVKANNYHEQ